MKRTVKTGFKAPFSQNSSNSQSEPPSSASAGETKSPVKNSKLKLKVSKEAEANKENVPPPNPKIKKNQKPKTKTAQQDQIGSGADSVDSSKKLKVIKTLTDEQYDDIFMSAINRVRTPSPSPTGATRRTPSPAPQVNEKINLDESLPHSPAPENKIISSQADSDCGNLSQTSTHSRCSNIDKMKKSNREKQRKQMNEKPRFKSLGSKSQKEKIVKKSHDKSTDRNKKVDMKKRGRTVRDSQVKSHGDNQEARSRSVNGSMVKTLNSSLNKSLNRSLMERSLNHSLDQSITRSINDSFNLSIMDQQLQSECSKGVWVQCANVSCCKWRYLDYIHDPSELIDVKWYCNMNKDTQRNSCESITDSWDDTAEWTYNEYAEGSIVWAKLSGYPWWPAMVEVDPDLDCFIFCNENRLLRPVEYHVAFFDSDKPTRAWIPTKDIKTFNKPPTQETAHHGVKYSTRLKKCISMAEEAASMSLTDRIRKYAFRYNYKGPIGKHKKEIQSMFTIIGKRVLSKKDAESKYCNSKSDKSSAREKLKLVNKRRIKHTSQDEPRQYKSKSKIKVHKTVDQSSDKSRKDEKSSDKTFSSEREGNTSRGRSVDKNNKSDVNEQLDEIEELLQRSSQSFKRHQSLSPAPSSQSRLSQYGVTSSQPQQSGNTDKTSQSQIQSGTTNKTSQSSVIFTGSPIKLNTAAGNEVEIRDNKKNDESSKKRSTIDDMTESNIKKRKTSSDKNTFNAQLNLKDSVITHELSGKKGLGPLDKSVFTQELSAKTHHSGLRLDRSVFTQELSGKHNKPTLMLKGSTETVSDENTSEKLFSNSNPTLTSATRVDNSDKSSANSSFSDESSDEDEPISKTNKSLNFDLDSTHDKSILETSVEIPKVLLQSED